MNQRVISVVEYDSNWKTLFDKEQIKLSEVMAPNAVLIEHIGSTSIAGMAAKPIIDIMVEVSDIDAVTESVSGMEALGYLAKGENGIAGRRYFQKGGNQRSHHVHVFQSGDENLIRHRAFKEYVQSHTDVAKRYMDIKKAAVGICNNDINVYMALKNDFIHEHEKLALCWYNNKT